MRSAALLVALCLSACDGGGTSSQPPPSDAVAPPPAPVPAPPPPPLSGTILVGDEMVANWQQTDPGSYPAGARNAGVAGATTAQLAARFQADVLDRRPAVVVLSGGLNDLRNTGGLNDPANLYSMAGQAQQLGACVVLVDLLPMNVPPEQTLPVATYNLDRQVWAGAYAYRHVATFPAFATADKLRAEFDAGDGLHINAAGYAVLGQLVAAGIAACGV